jgi:hypothetical protein
LYIVYVDAVSDVGEAYSKIWVKESMGGLAVTVPKSDSNNIFFNLIAFTLQSNSKNVFDSRFPSASSPFHMGC